MNSSDADAAGGGEDKVSKAAGFFSLRRYRKHFNVDTMVSELCNAPSLLLFHTDHPLDQKQVSVATLVPVQYAGL